MAGELIQNLTSMKFGLVSGAFLKISGGEELGAPFISLPTLMDRQRRVRQLLAVVAIMEMEWDLRRLAQNFFHGLLPTSYLHILVLGQICHRC